VSGHSTAFLAGAWDPLVSQFGVPVTLSGTHRGTAASESIVVLDMPTTADPTTTDWEPIANPSLVTAAIVVGLRLVDASGGEWAIKRIDERSSGLTQMFCTRAEDVS